MARVCQHVLLQGPCAVAANGCASFLRNGALRLEIAFDDASAHWCCRWFDARGVRA